MPQCLIIVSSRRARRGILERAAKYKDWRFKRFSYVFIAFYVHIPGLRFMGSWIGSGQNLGMRSDGCHYGALWLLLQTWGWPLSCSGADEDEHDLEEEALGMW